MCPFYTDLHERLIIDVAESYASPAVKQESKLDIAVMRRRVRREGISFLTKTLPKLGKALDKALSQGTKFAPLGFITKPNSTIPKFLGWLFELVFSDQGEVLSSASPRAVRDLRLCLYILYKLEIPYTDDQEEQVLLAFQATDLGLPSSVASDDVIVHARNFITNVFGSFDPHDVIPKHGPGAVATGEKNHEKHRFSRLYSSIERQYPFTEYFVYSLDHLSTDPGYLANQESLSAGTAKVVLVPKDSRGPRLISCEPLEYQWIQGGLGGAIKQHLELHPLTKGHVNFTDQEVNRQLALASSLDAKWVTLDMKDASDRVSVALVAELFRDCPTLLDCLMATRTPETMLPNGNIVTMKKFAPMGSNLCFPIEAVVFMALGVGVIMTEQLREHPCSEMRHRALEGERPHYAASSYSALMWRASRRLYVYGDDIISKREDYALLLQYFPKVGLMFNPDKCCTHGSFRESCGMDAFKGVCVTPLRLKRRWMYGRKQAPETYCSYVAFSNAAYARGLHRVASFVLEAVEASIGRLPIFRERQHEPRRDHHIDYGVLCWVRPYSHDERGPTPWQVRFNSDLQRREFRVLHVVPRKVIVDSTDWCMVLRRLSSSKHGSPG
ncbi:RNA-directed RNA polymerase, partial [ssRNA phage Zoerhiza.1_33]